MARLVWFTIVKLLLLAFSKTVPVIASPRALKAVSSWSDAHATFYGGQHAPPNMDGACGYGNVYSAGFGTSTAAVSSALYNDGLNCGACFQLECKLEASRSCFPGKAITVTAMSNCPQGTNGGWCDGSRHHFDLSLAMFETLALPRSGVIPVQYRRVTCQRQGGVRFTILGNLHCSYVIVYNVAGGGDVAALSVHAETPGWVTMVHSWGQVWSTNASIVGQELSFRPTLGDGHTLEFQNVTDKNWAFGQTYEATDNFL